MAITGPVNFPGIDIFTNMAYFRAIRMAVKSQIYNVGRNSITGNSNVKNNEQQYN
jgi:hypothetical protein